MPNFWHFIWRFTFINGKSFTNSFLPMKRALFISFLAFATISCKQKQAVAKEPIPSNGKICKTPESLLKAASQNHIDYKWFTARAKVAYQGPPESATFQVNIRMKKDSLIWATFSKFGFEGARLRITPSRFELLNRLNNTIMVKDYSYLTSQFNISLTFEQLQDILVGNVIGLGDGKKLSVNSEECCCNLNASDGYEASKAVFDLQSLLLKSLMGVVSAGQYDFAFNDYAQVGRFQFAQKRDVKIKTSRGEDITAMLDYSDIAFDIEKSTNFEVPEHYQKL